MTVEGKHPRILLFAAAVAGLSASAWAAPGLDREKFHISCFSFNPPAHTEQHVREAKECGMDFLSGGIDAKNVKLMQICADVGIELNGIGLPRVCGGGQDSADLRKKYPREQLERMLDEFNAVHSPQVVRLMNICDEPGVCSMEFLGDVVRLVGEKCPQTLAYVNLFPNYAQAAESDASVKTSQLGTTSYGKYIDEYCRLVPTHFISFDHYPIMRTPAQTRAWSPRWYGNLKVVADACRRTGRDLWVGPQANSRPKHPPLSENNLRYQAFSAMAFGAVDLTWACWTLGWWDNCLMETNGTLTCQYPKLKKVNAEVLSLAGPYMKLRNVATHFVGFADLKEDLAKYGIVPSGRADAGAFADVSAEDGSSLVVGEMVPRDAGSNVRAIFVFGADDSGDERQAAHVVRFRAKGTVRVFGPNGPVEAVRKGDGDWRLRLADNSAALILLK